jgi:uncharacterized protein YukE
MTYQELKRRVEGLSEQAARARGALDSEKAKLQEEFECESVEAAKELEQRMRHKHTQLQKKLDEALEEFEDELSSIKTPNG